MKRGLLLAAVQVAMVLSIGAKLLADRASLPRVWVRTAPYDPNLPVRGRYVRLMVEAEPRGFGSGVIYAASRLSAEDGKLIARPDEGGNVMVTISGNRARLSEAVAYFIPEHVPDPSRRPVGEELWVEVSVPKRGPPRPIQLGVRRDGVLRPLEVK
ncbi:MAG: GDYXXLXY domain-containing protein [Acidobacteriia bacterium]|nr:GDYXXLXY domain-containing protein [Terriglobia bacterium]